MISKLHIQNIGIIEDVEIDFQDKLNIITGETGSGKTLILESISLVTGNRISKDIIRTGEDFAFIEVCFLCDIPDISQDGMIILSRQFYANGKNICKVNGQMATLTYLKSIGDLLVDIHQQHDNNMLLNPNMHLELLDSYIGKELNNVKVEYLELLNKQKEVINQMKNLCADPIERQRKLELLEYQFNEIENANLKLDEEEKLIERKTVLQNSEKIHSNLNEGYEVIDNLLLGNIDILLNKLSNISKYDNKYEKMYDNIQNMYYELEDIKMQIYDDISKNELSEDELEQVVDRLDNIFKLKRKYGNNIEEVLQYFEKIQIEINQMHNLDEIVKKLNIEFNENNEKLFYLCLKMHNIRIENAKKVQNMINNELVSLEMPKAKFEIQVLFNDNVFEYENDKKYSFNENGLNKVNFMICTNLGGKMQMINKIASGGELSRITLALKTVFIDSYKIPTIVFDEIDTGLSGQAIISLGEKFKLIGNNHQVIIVTHNANIAAIGNNNVFVEKIFENEKTKTKVKILNYEEKVNEICRILNGNNITDNVIKHAKDLIG